MPRPRKVKTAWQAKSARSDSGAMDTSNDGGSSMELDNDLPDNASPDCGSSLETYDTESLLNCPAEDNHPIAQIVLFISMFSALVFSLSRSSSDMLLQLLSRLVGTVLGMTASDESAMQLMADIPKDSRTVRSRYQLDGGTVVYAVCPKCHFLYRPREVLLQNEPRYPKVCTNTTETSRLRSKCNAALLHEDSMTPIKKFIYHPLKHYIASLLVRDTIEGLLDKSCDDLLESVNKDEDFLKRHGPFEADFMRRFEGHQPDTLFIQRGDELRLAFCLNVDFFSVKGVRPGESSATCGIIALTCLNLPPDIRYKDENVFLAGIIPGPDEPPLTDINHYLSPLIDEFVSLWDPGVRFSRTATSPHGRIARAAIALVACDLPAARKVAGLLSFLSKALMCSRCYCPRDSIKDVSLGFPVRDAETLRAQAYLWKNAKTQSQRNKIENDKGVRWSELWRLPYWDPTTQLVVDPMHCLLLGLVHNHFTGIFPISTKLAESTPTDPPYKSDFKKIPSEARRVVVGGKTYAIQAEDIQDVPKIHGMLLRTIDPNEVEEERATLERRLGGRRRMALLFVVDSLGLGVSSPGDPNVVMTRVECAKALTEWRFGKPLYKSMKLTTTSFMDHVQHVIRFTSVPSFVRSVPMNFGDSGAGKTKADEWRTLSTVYLPLALISYCFYSGKVKDTEFKDRFTKVIEHTMELVQAVKLVCQKSICQSEIDAYDKHIKTYITDLETVHPTASFLPNMHMALHITDFLSLYGSAYSWWANPFERLIYKLQETQSNNKIGELEITMSNVFLTTSRLKQRLSPGNCHPALEEFIQIVDETFDPTHMNPRKRRWDGKMKAPANAKAMPDAAFILNNYSDKLMSRCRWNGAQYYARGSERHEGNSQIVFRPEGEEKAFVGFIEYIMVGDDPVFIVRRLHLHSEKEDFFARYPDALMAVFQFRDDQELEVVKSREILGHFAAYELAKDFYAAIPLCKLV